MTGDAENVIDAASAWLDRGARVAIATVTRTWSSSPRPPGSQLALDEEGRFEGSVSGGCVEAAVIDAGLDVIATGTPQVLEFGVSNERAWEVGLACGGRVEVHVALADKAPLATVAALRRTRATFITTLNFESGVLHVYPEADLPEPLRALAAELEREADATRVLEAGDQRLFVRLERPPPRIVCVGAVHLTQVLAQLSQLAGFEPIVIDPRAAFATPERFPRVEIRHTWPEPAFAQLGIDRHTAIVTLSHDPKLDEPALCAALRSNAFYIGALGSRKTQAARQRRLAEAGFTPEQLARVHGPVGLAIGAKSTAEIAISIIAQVIAARRGVA